MAKLSIEELTSRSMSVMIWRSPRSVDNGSHNELRRLIKGVNLNFGTWI